jgi:pseudouridine-5'-phosphate glycosidase
VINQTPPGLSGFLLPFVASSMRTPETNVSQGYSLRFLLDPSVARRLSAGEPVVALESTVIAHGLPAPHNLETARACEAVVRQQNATPATIGLIAGRPVIGLNEEQIQAIAEREDVVKVNLSNLAQVVAEGRWGATTVAASLQLARMVGIRVLATGGIGGVHRGASESFDISADILALARSPLIVVCAGAKAILDLPRTIEVLETIGVPVVGYQTDELPAFYSRSSGIKLELRAERPEQVAKLAHTHWQLGSSSAVLVAVPVPAEQEVLADEIKGMIDETLAEATREGISGKALTPFLLTRMAERSSGRALEANVALLKNNARVAAEIACALCAHHLI